MKAQLRFGGMIVVIAAYAVSLHAQDSLPKSERQPEADSSAGELFGPLLASPTEPASLLRYAGDSQMDFGLAQPFALYTVESKDSAWQVGLRPGIVSRFQVRNTQLVLQAADFRLGVPVAYRRGKWSTRVELFHVSSHRGADFAGAGAGPPFSYSRETLQALVAYGDSGHWRVYAGPSLIVRTHPSVGRWALQAGSEWFPKALARPRVRGFLAEDVVAANETGWHANISVHPGLLFTNSQGRSVARLSGWFYHGEVPFGQFFQTRETRGGVQLALELQPAIKSLVTRHR